MESLKAYIASAQENASITTMFMFPIMSLVVFIALCFLSGANESQPNIGKWIIVSTSISALISFGRLTIIIKCSKHIISASCPCKILKVNKEDRVIAVGDAFWKEKEYFYFWYVDEVAIFRHDRECGRLEFPLTKNSILVLPFSLRWELDRDAFNYQEVYEKLVKGRPRFIGLDTYIKERWTKNIVSEGFAIAMLAYFHHQINFVDLLERFSLTVPIPDEKSSISFVKNEIFEFQALEIIFSDKPKEITRA